MKIRTERTLRETIHTISTTDIVVGINIMHPKGIFLKINLKRKPKIKKVKTNSAILDTHLTLRNNIISTSSYNIETN